MVEVEALSQNFRPPTKQLPRHQQRHWPTPIIMEICSKNDLFGAIMRKQGCVRAATKAATFLPFWLIFVNFSRAECSPRFYAGEKGHYSGYKST